MIIIIFFIAVYVAGILSIIFEPNPFGWDVDEGKHKTPLWVHYYFIGTAMFFALLIILFIVSILGIFI